MDLYTLDSQLRRIEVIDEYISLIWTERYNELGDFELEIADNPTIRDTLAKGTRVVILESNRVMEVEDIESSEDEDGNNILTFKGFEISKILDQRAAMPSMASLTTRSKWEVTGPPADIIRSLVRDICLDGDLDAYDVIPYLQSGSLTPAGNIPEPSTSVTMTFDLGTLYEAVRKVCVTYNLGFRMIRNYELSQLYFEVYTGDDRTTSQQIKPAVIFSKNLDSLSNIKEYSSIGDYKNVAYVFAKNGYTKVYADGVPTTISGFDRRVLYVNADDITLAAGTALDAAMLQRGREELAKCKPIIAFDGEIPQYTQYKYRTDYNLGDLVEIRASSGNINNMRVTENIFISDSEGFRSYPTLTFDQIVVQGTWLSWSPTQKWSDVPNDTNNEWADLT